MMEQLTKQRHNLGSGGVDVGKGLTFNDLGTQTSCINLKKKAQFTSKSAKLDQK